MTAIEIIEKITKLVEEFSPIHSLTGEWGTEELDDKLEGVRRLYGDNDNQAYLKLWSAQGEVGPPTLWLLPPSFDVEKIAEELLKLSPTRYLRVWPDGWSFTWEIKGEKVFFMAINSQRETNY